MKVFLIGGTGLLGSAGAGELIRRGHEVHSMALPPVPRGAGLPSPMQLTLGNYMALSDEELRKCMEGCDGLVFAAGIDDRMEGPAPIYDLFQKYNILPLKRLLAIARSAGIRRVVVLGSYFSFLARAWNDLKLCETHPYIRSRVDQAAMALSFADENMAVAVLEFPYVFGAQPGRRPVWVFLVEQIRRWKRATFCPGGGTAAITVRQAGQCIAGALERNRGAKNIPVGGFNLTWKEMLGMMHRHLGVPRKPIVALPAFLVRLGLASVMAESRRRGVQPGLDAAGLASIMARNAFIDPTPVMEELGVAPDDIDNAIGESIRLCLDILDRRQPAIGMRGE